MTYELLQKGRTISSFKKLDLKYVWQLFPDTDTEILSSIFVFPPIVRATQKKT